MAWEVVFHYHFDFNGLDSTLNQNHKNALAVLFLNPHAIWHISNAKFDMHFLLNEGIEIVGKVVCIGARERVIKNNYFPAQTQYALDAMSKRYLGEGKDEAVEDYIYANNLYEKVMIPGKKKLVDDMHFDQVPLSITEPYGSKDGRLHLGVGLAQEKKLAELALAYPPTHIYGSVIDVVKNEIELTKTCFAMEREGIKVNVDYTNAAMAYENGEMVKLKEDFMRLTGLPYRDSRTTFVEAFKKLDLKYPLTAAGNPSFDKKALANIDNPVAGLIKGIRKFDKRIGTYYSSFIYFRDRNDIIHPNINQGGTETARMSYSEPNLQNVPKEDEEEDLKKPYVVRGCFEPDEGMAFVDIDWRQQEFRLLLDYAGEHELIAAINEGADPHVATAEQTGLTRKAAKTRQDES